MGKRSKFDRNPKDFYETPESAVKPLLPHLGKNYNFVDPCAGNGLIGQHLSKHCPGGMSWWDFDIEIYNDNHLIADATSHIYGLFDHDMFITNPPWSRHLLHAIIDNLSGQKPTWLLFDADWMHTKQAIPYLKYCVKIVSIGRVSWMGNGVSGMDNCCWYLFDKSFNGQTQLIGRAA